MIAISLIGFGAVGQALARVEELLTLDIDQSKIREARLSVAVQTGIAENNAGLPL